MTQIGDRVVASDGAQKHLQNIRRGQREHQQKVQEGRDRILAPETGQAAKGGGDEERA